MSRLAQNLHRRLSFGLRPHVTGLRKSFRGVPAKAYISTTSSTAGQTQDVNVEPPKDPEVQEWLVIIPDRKGVLEKRIQIRPKHSPNFVRLHSEGYVSWAGPVFARPCVRKPTHEDRPFMGSMMVVNDVTPDNIYKRLASDPFITERIWDWENAEILPFKTIMRDPLRKNE